MDPVTMAAIGGGLSAGLGFLGASEQAKEMKKLMAKLNTLWAKQKALNETAYGKSEAILKSVIESTGLAYDSAKGDIGFAGNVAKQGASDIYKQALGGINAGAVASGKFGSSLQASAQMGAAGQLAKTVAGIDAATGQQQANLALAKNQAVSGAKGALASLFPQQAQNQQNWMLQKMNFLQANPPQNPYAGAGGALGNIFGAMSQGQALGAQTNFYNAMANQASLYGINPWMT